jgi:hypothetical protein
MIWIFIGGVVVVMLVVFYALCVNFADMDDEEGTR